MYRNAPTRFEALLAAHAHVQSVHCVHLSTPLAAPPTNSDAGRGELGTSNLVITSHSADTAQALAVRCPHGGASFFVEQLWRQEAGSVHVRTTTERHEVKGSFVVAAKQTDWTSSAMTVVADQMRLQSSTSPFDIHSFSTHKHGLALRCPKGGVVLSSGSGGMQHTTTGDVDVDLQGDHTHLRLASRGHKAHTIHLGNAATETVVENQLTVKGKLVLADDTVIEKRVSVVHELQNVIELGGAHTQCGPGPHACAEPTSAHPDAGGFDFAVVARQQPHRKSGIVFDHTRQLFYFGADLGSYQHHRFALPNAYADVQARVFLAQEKMQAPFVDAHAVQCRSVRSGSVLTLQAPRVQCTQKLACASVQSELAYTVQLKSHATATEELDVGTRATVAALDVRGALRVGPPNKQLRADRWWFNTVGPHATHATLQDFLDAADDARQAGDTALAHSHAVMETTHTPHSCNALVNQPSLTLDGRHSILTGVLEITEECERLLVVDARVAQLTLSTSGEYTRDTPRPTVYTLRNVHGTAKDWCFHLPKGVLRLEHCSLTFTNQVIGELQAVEVVQSVVRGGPWRGLRLSGKSRTPSDPAS